MRNQRIVEIWVGVFVILGLAALFGLAMKVSNIAVFQQVKGYEVTANFQNVGGLRVSAPVSMGGVQIGRVKSITLNKKTFQAEVTMTIESRFNDIPTDTSASILTSGLLGEKYVGLEPGGAPDSLKQGDTIQLTQSAVILEHLISKFLFNKASGS